MRETTKKDLGRTLFFECYLCGRAFGDEKLFSEHIRGHTTEEKALLLQLTQKAKTLPEKEFNELKFEVHVKYELEKKHGIDINALERKGYKMTSFLEELMKRHNKERIWELVKDSSSKLRRKNRVRKRPETYLET